MIPNTQPDIASLAARARMLASQQGRAIIGLAGAPGAGKSLVTEALAAALGDDAAVFGMDAFHLADAELARLGRADRKGAPDTFDVSGYVETLLRIRRGDGDVYAPVFDRSLEAAVAGSVLISARTPIVLTEGNYLLHDSGGWENVRPVLDEVWFVQTEHDERFARLIARHEQYGRTTEAAHEWVQRSDEQNARLVAATASRADLVVRNDAGAAT